MSQQQQQLRSYDGRIPPTDPKYETIYLDKEYIVVNKPFDVNIDDENGERSTTVVKYIETEYPEQLGNVRFVNRIDYATSGLVVVSFNKKSTTVAMELFQSRETSKTYLAIVHGHMELDESIIDKPIQYDTSDENSFKMQVVEGNNTNNNNNNNNNNDRLKTTTTTTTTATTTVKDKSNPAKPSQTSYKVLERSYLKINNDQYIPITKVMLFPKTGRRHQLRVHLLSIGHIIVGDETYGPKDSTVDRMMLHSWKLILPFKHRSHINVECNDPFLKLTISQTIPQQ
ncbi:hypothetical protein ACTFIV_007697 [Dictyostelium citrinum]